MKNITLLGIIFLSLVFARRDCLQYAKSEALGRTMRPENDTFAISLSGHFYIHYDTTGNAAPDMTDIDGNGIPDYVDEVGIMADSAHHVLVDLMGYDEEPDDKEGGYDIYIKYYGSDYVYGYNYKESGGASYLEIDNDYGPQSEKSNFNLSPIQIMRISLAHEYFHGIQWGYEDNHVPNEYFYEMTSMWFEDVLIPDGNDYLDGWADPLLDNPTADFDNTGKGYELALFGHYLSSFIDEKGIEDAKESTIMREIWERYSEHPTSAFLAVKHVLSTKYDVPFIEAWVDFISRNLYNGIYTDMDNFYYYIDQKLIDPIKTNSADLEDSVDFELELDDKSATIKSYRIGDLESIFTIEHAPENFTGRIAIVSNNKPERNNLFWGGDTTTEEPYSNVKIHFVYGVDGTSITLPIDITAHTVPLQPSDLIAVSAQDSIILSWSPSPGPGDSLYYVVYRDEELHWVSIDSDTNYVDLQDIEGGQYYTYQITCRNNVGESQPSSAVMILSWPKEEDVVKTEILSIYPNPVSKSQNNIILFSLDQDNNNPKIELINIRGQIVNTQKIYSTSQGWHRVSIEEILSNKPAAGIYFIRLKSNNGKRETAKITIIN